MDSIPIIAITGQVGTQVLGNDAFQETPMVEICRGITKHHYLLTRIEDVARVVKEAFHIATTGRPGPVLIDICKDVQIRQDRARTGTRRWTCPATGRSARPGGPNWSR